MQSHVGYDNMKLGICHCFCWTRSLKEPKLVCVHTLNLSLYLLQTAYLGASVRGFAQKAVFLPDILNNNPCNLPSVNFSDF